MDSNPIEKLTLAVEEKTRAEIETANLERQRLATEQLRQEKELSNAETLEKIAFTIESLAMLVGNLQPSIVAQGERIELILELIKVIASWLHTQGYREAGRLDSLIRDINRGDMKVDIHNNRDVTTGDFIDGNKTINLDVVIEKAVDLIEQDRLDDAEDLLNSLPEDILDVAVAALSGPLCAAKVIVQKVRGKARLFKKNE